jgi:anti-sigma factor RsiW
MLTCRDVAKSATDYMEGELSLRESLQVRVHLLMCGFCRLYVRQLAATRDALRRLPRPLPSDEDMERLLRMFRSRVDDDQSGR